jgi:hypothetical protein
MLFTLEVQSLWLPSSAIFHHWRLIVRATNYITNSGCRAILLAFGTTAILPLIERVGAIGTDTITAGLAWIGFG